MLSVLRVVIVKICVCVVCGGFFAVHKTLADSSAVQKLVTSGTEQVDPATHLRHAIATWLSVAVPPSNRLFGTQFRYNEWGQLVGETTSGRTINAQTPPDIASLHGMSSHSFVWQLRTHLDSIEHCTLDVYVTHALAGTSTEFCKDRYVRTVPDLTGLSALAVDNSLHALGLRVQVLPGTLAPTAKLVSKVQRQRPLAHQPFIPGDTIKVWLFSARDVLTRTSNSTQYQADGRSDGQ